MTRTFRKTLSVLLALVMVLALCVPAFAAGDEQPEKELRWVHLDWNQEGKCFASDGALKTDNPGEGNGTTYDPSRNDAVLFFIWNNTTGKREGYVIPTAGENLVVEKVDRDAIASGAKQASNYVFLGMTEFKDGELTANGLTFTVTAALPPFGFYSAETPSMDAFLAHEADAADLTGNTLYLYSDLSEENDTVTGVEKANRQDDPSGTFYDIEKVEDGLWKITINEKGQVALPRGGVNVYLHLTVTRSDDSTYDWNGGVFVRAGNDQGPQLYFVMLEGEWDEAAEEDKFFLGERPGWWGGTMTHGCIWPDNPHVGFFCTVKDGQQIMTENGFNASALTPVAVNTLKLPEGVTVESASGQARRGEKWSRYFAALSVAEMGKEYTITSGDYSLTINSGLPDIGVYSAPEATLDNWLGHQLPLHPAYGNDCYIISLLTDAVDGQHLTEAKLSAANQENATGILDLEKVSENVYRLKLKSDAAIDKDWYRLELDLTWEDFTGNTWTDTNSYGGDFEIRPPIIASDTALTEDYGELAPFSEIAGKVTTSVSMTTGEDKAVYLYTTPMRRSEDGKIQLMYTAYEAYIAPSLYHSSDEALTLTMDEDDPAKFTLSASKAGTYEIWFGETWDFDTLKLYHADGTAYTDAETEAWKADESFYLYFDVEGNIFIYDADKDASTAVPFEEYFEGERYELEPGEFDSGFRHLTVTVENAARTFSDVPADTWYTKEVEWAARKGIVAGTGADTFSPTMDCTYAHILTFLWRAVGEPESDVELPFAPKHDWSQAAVTWAYEVGIISGSDFDEDAPCTRAGAVNCIWQALEKPAASYDGRFTDVAADAAYAQAVAWAVDAGVTGGDGPNTFSPDKVCNRATIATFLYRAFNK